MGASLGKRKGRTSDPALVTQCAENQRINNRTRLPKVVRRVLSPVLVTRRSGRRHSRGAAVPGRCKPRPNDGVG